MFNYYSDFKECFYTKFKVEKIVMDIRKSDIATNYGEDPFYDQEFGVFYPLKAGGKILAYLVVQINKSNLPTSKRLTAEAIEALASTNVLKLMPKTVKVLTTVSAGNKISAERHRNNADAGPPVKIKQSEIMKALLLGYLEAPSEEALIDVLIESNYDLQSKFRYDKSVSLSSKIEQVNNFINNVNKANNASYDWGQHCSRAAGSNLSYRFTRSFKKFDENHVVKWRRPNKNSVWPWTLDHHWFIVQESPITLANYTYKALLGSSGQGLYQKKDRIDMQYPIFLKSNAVDQGRKLLETFFKEVVGNRSKSKWGDVVYCTQLMRWTSDNPCFIIPKLCMVLGVMPTFDVSGKFQKFVPLAGNFNQPKKKLHLEFNAIDVSQSHSLDPFITVALSLCYDLGIVKLDAVEKTLGIVNAGSALANNDNYFKVSIGKNTVCCIPNSYSWNFANSAINKFETTAKLKTTNDPVFSAC
jgi:hypothetical protein